MTVPLSEKSERALEVIAANVREQVAQLDADEDEAIRRLVKLLTGSTREADRERIRDRARMMTAQGGRCAVCSVPFAESPPATRRQVPDRLLCVRCAREIKNAPSIR